MHDLNLAKAAYDEALLESALLKLGYVMGRQRHLVDFNWRFTSGTEANIACCGYMLLNCSKFAADEAAREILQVVEDNSLTEALDPKAVAWLQAEEEPSVAS
mmetsp:Transcript_39763/g.112827  ORF Transcript_39763/g.112827 Transcript_39763/m.112827 type:complete len:102 (+) Transcript_39763:668-973(+)